MAGLFITLEGIDGCGKSTQASLLCAYFRKMGRTVVHTREPGGTPLGSALRKIFLDRKGTDLTPRTEVLMMGADRADHVATVIRPALERGETVVCERYIDSTLAYQGFGRSEGEAFLRTIRAINAFATEGLLPDVTILLDIDPNLAQSRRRRNPDRIEAKTRSYHRRVRSGYLSIAKAHPERVSIVDARKNPRRVHATIVELLTRFERGREPQGSGRKHHQ